MPTVWTKGKLRIVLRTRNEHNPPHVHASLGDKSASIEIRTLKVTANTGFNLPDLNEIAEVIELHQEHWLELWEQYHGKK